MPVANVAGSLHTIEPATAGSASATVPTLTRDAVDSRSTRTPPPRRNGWKASQDITTGDPLYHVAAASGDVSRRPYVGPVAASTCTHPHASV